MGHLSNHGGDRPGKADRYYWKAELRAILKANNWAHSTLPKGVSYKTMEDRETFLFSMFNTLWYDLPPPKMRVMPRNFALRHVKPLVAYWLEQQLSPGTIRQYFSYLRTFCEWIGKGRMVHEVEQFVDDPARVKRVYAAKEDRSWRSHGVDAAEKIAEMEAICPYAGCQAELKVAYALRPKETFMIRPHEAERDGHLMVTTEEDPERYAELTQLEVKRGTKGGRVRWVPIDTPEEKVGLTRKQLGVTPYGARHQYAGDRYEQCAGEPPPVRGGKPIDRELDKAARLQVARDLGHSRESITGAYLGGVLRAKRSGSDSNGE